MKKGYIKKIVAFNIVFFMLFSMYGCGENKIKNNDADKQVLTENKKVVAGTVAVAQMLDKMGYKEVVGVPDTSYDLGNYKDAKKIGKPKTPDAEIVKSLNPDIFMSEKTLKDSTEKSIRSLNINTMFLDLSSYDKIIDSIKEVGNKLGKASESTALIKEIEAKANEAMKKTEGKNPSKVLFLFGTPKSVMVGTDSSYVGSLLKKINANNIGGNNDKGFIPLSLESIIAENPDIILVMNHADPQASKKMVEKTFSENPAISQLNAVKNNKVVYLDEDIFSVTGNVHVGDALIKLVNIVYE